MGILLRIVQLNDTKAAAAAAWVGGWLAGSTRSKAEYQLCQLNGRNLHKRTGGIDDKSKFNCLRPDRASIITLSDTAPLEIPFFTRIDGDLLTPKYVPIAVCYYITIRSGCVHKTNFIVLCQRPKCSPKTGFDCETSKSWTMAAEKIG